MEPSLRCLPYRWSPRQELRKTFAILSLSLYLFLSITPRPFTLSFLSSPSRDHPVFPLSLSLQAFFEGKLKMRGNIMLSQKLDSLLKDHAKL